MCIQFVYFLLGPLTPDLILPLCCNTFKTGQVTQTQAFVVILNNLGEAMMLSERDKKRLCGVGGQEPIE